MAVDDASSDDSREILLAWALKDPRLKVHSFGRHQGVAAAANFAIRQARGHFIARSDADDVNHLERLEVQYKLLHEVADHSAIATSLAESIDSEDQVVMSCDRSRLWGVHGNVPFACASLMARRELFLDNPYCKECELWEDLDLILRLSQCSRFFVLLKPYYQYRQHRNHNRFSTDWNIYLKAMSARAASLRGLQKTGRYSQRPGEPTREDELYALHSLATLRLWSHQPLNLRGALKMTDLFPFCPTPLKMLVLAIGGECHPSALRWLMGRFAQVRDWIAGCRLGWAEVVEWSPLGTGPIVHKNLE